MRIRKGCKQPATHELGEIIVATIELVVPQDESIETELVDGLCDLFATVVLEVQGSLRTARQKLMSSGADQNWKTNLELVTNVEE